MSTRARRLDLGALGYRTGYIVGILFFLASTLLPLVFVVSVSFKPPAEVFGNLALIPNEPTLQAWESAFSRLREPLMNSFLVALGTTVLSLFITIPGAYAFARTDFKGQTMGFYTIIVAMAFPYIILVIPVTSLWFDLGLFNTLPGLWLAYQIFVTPFALWVLTDYFRKIPANMEEAAQVYGCTQFTAFVRVILPMAVPGITAVAFLAFLTGWNDFLFSNLLTLGTGPQPAVPVLFNIIGGTSGERVYWALLMAMVLLIGIPPTIFYVMARRKLAEAFAVN